MTSSFCILMVGQTGLIVDNLKIRMRNLRRRNNLTSGYWVSKKDSMHGIPIFAYVAFAVLPVLIVLPHHLPLQTNKASCLRAINGVGNTGQLAVQRPDLPISLLTQAILYLNSIPKGTQKPHY